MIWEVLFIIFAIILAFPVIIFAFEIIFALLAQQQVVLGKTKNIPRPGIAVLVPAHNEESVIAETLKHICVQLNEADKLLVVADNCDDETANIARQSGAIVLERTDFVNQGKGFALDYGVRYLAKNAPDVVVFIDADCTVGEGLIERISALSISENRPVQSLYLMQNKKISRTLRQRFAEFAWQIKNHARPLGLRYIDLPCQLMGSGMAVPFNQLNDISIANSNLVEDMQMGIDLTKAGYPPLFCEDVKVTSPFPESTLTAECQRERWEHGHIDMIISMVPSLIVKSITSRDYLLFSLALDLIIPPLTLLATLVVLTFSLIGVASVFLDLKIAFYLSGINLLLFIFTVFLAWLGYGRNILSFREIIFLPFQMLIKIPLYIRFVINRQKKWVRTKRD